MEGDSAALLAPLEECDVPLVVVPEGVFRLIEKSEFKKAILSPETSYPYLKVINPTFMQRARSCLSFFRA